MRARLADSIGKSSRSICQHRHPSAKRPVSQSRPGSCDAPKIRECSSARCTGVRRYSTLSAYPTMTLRVSVTRHKWNVNPRHVKRGWVAGNPRYRQSRGFNPKRTINRRWMADVERAWGGITPPHSLRGGAIPLLFFVYVDSSYTTKIIFTVRRATARLRATGSSNWVTQSPTGGLVIDTVLYIVQRGVARMLPR